MKKLLFLSIALSGFLLSGCKGEICCDNSAIAISSGNLTFRLGGPAQIIDLTCSLPWIVETPSGWTGVVNPMNGNPGAGIPISIAPPATLGTFQITFKAANGGKVSLKITVVPEDAKLMERVYMLDDEDDAIANEVTEPAYGQTLWAFVKLDKGDIIVPGTTGASYQWYYVEEQNATYPDNLVGVFASDEYLDVSTTQAGKTLAVRVTLTGVDKVANGSYLDWIADEKTVPYMVITDSDGNAHTFGGDANIYTVSAFARGTYTLLERALNDVEAFGGDLKFYIPGTGEGPTLWDPNLVSVKTYIGTLPQGKYDNPTNPSNPDEDYSLWITVEDGGGNILVKVVVTLEITTLQLNKVYVYLEENARTTLVTTPLYDQTIYAHLELNDGTTWLSASSPFPTGTTFNWYQKENPGASLGSNHFYKPVLADDGKTICVEVTLGVSGIYDGGSHTWEADSPVPFLKVDGISYHDVQPLATRHWTGTGNPIKQGGPYNDASNDLVGLLSGIDGAGGTIWVELPDGSEKAWLGSSSINDIIIDYIENEIDTEGDYDFVFTLRNGTTEYAQVTVVVHIVIPLMADVVEIMDYNDNTSAPTTLGVPMVGDVLAAKTTLTDGSLLWDAGTFGAGTNIVPGANPFFWYHADDASTNIGDGTGIYTVKASDAGKQIRVKVTLPDTDLINASSATSAPTMVVPYLTINTTPSIPSFTPVTFYAGANFDLTSVPITKGDYTLLNALDIEGAGGAGGGVRYSIGSSGTDYSWGATSIANIITYLENTFTTPGSNNLDIVVFVSDGTTAFITVTVKLRIVVLNSLTNVEVVDASGTSVSTPQVTDVLYAKATHADGTHLLELTSTVPANTAYHWYHVGAPSVSIGTGTSYTVSAADHGEQIGVRITYTGKTNFESPTSASGETPGEVPFLTIESATYYGNTNTLDTSTDFTVNQGDYATLNGFLTTVTGSGGVAPGGLFYQLPGTSGWLPWSIADIITYIDNFEESDADVNKDLTFNLDVAVRDVTPTTWVTVTVTIKVHVYSVSDRLDIIEDEFRNAIEPFGPVDVTTGTKNGNLQEIELPHPSLPFGGAVSWRIVSQNPSNIRVELSGNTLRIRVNTGSGDTTALHPGQTVVIKLEGTLTLPSGDTRLIYYDVDFTNP